MSQTTEMLYQRLFKSIPGKILVLRPGTYEIVAATDDYLKATSTQEADIVGKALFQVFPDNPSEKDADGSQNLKASLMRVERLKTADIMAIQRYPVLLADGTFREQFWSPVNTPVLDDAGNIEFIMHRVEEVTDIVLEYGADFAAGKDTVVLQDIILRSQELRRALSKLQEHEARLLTAERMLGLGAWEYTLDSKKLNWSKQVFAIYDFESSGAAPSFEQYISLIHPDDRQASLELYQAFEAEQPRQIEFEHRLITRDGSIKFIKGVGERHSTANGDVVVGYVQDITPLVHARDKLTDAERLLRLAGDKVKLGGWRVELSSGKVTWTPQTAAIHDMPMFYSPSSVAEAIEFYAPDYRDLIQSAFQRCVEQGDDVDVICRLQTRRGRQPWVRSIGSAVRDDQGNVIEVQGAFQDITVLQEARFKAEKAELQRLNLLENISDAFFALDTDWQFTYLNKKAEMLLERSRDELLGSNVWQEFPQAVNSEFERQYQLAMRNKQTSRFQAFYPPLNKWFDVTAYPVPEGLAVHFKDITAERQSQEQLRLVQAALARQNDIVMITEADRLNEPDGPRIVYVNDAFERLTGYSKSEAIGRTPRILQGPATDRGQLRRIRKALENNQAVRSEVLNYSKTGTPYWVELDITPLFDDSGQCRHFVAVERDITARRALDEKLRESQKLEAVGHLTGGVAHDFNNLLTVILGNAEMLAEMLSTADLRAMAQMTLSAAQRGAELTSRLLAFARRQPLDPKPTDINLLIEQMRPLIRRTLPEHIDLHYGVEQNLGLAEIDAGELDTALLNLVVNARDAMQAGGKLTIETANVMLDDAYASKHVDVEAGDYVMICVSDTGEGMSEDTVRQAFEPFYTTKAVGKGSGLGLSMVFGFTKQSGGHIKIYSELGEGTAIKMYFPRLRGELPATAKRVADEQPEGGTEHILVAEDDELVLQHLKAQLISLGYRVTTVMSGPEALTALQTNPGFDLLLTDIIMPGGMNGRQLADKAKQLNPQLKILFSSGYTENAILHHGRLDSGVALLSKPYTRLELATKVRAVLDQV